MDQRTSTLSIQGIVSSGRRRSMGPLSARRDEICRAFGHDIVSGTLNIVLSSPIGFSNETAIRTSDGERLFWRAELGGIPVWLYRWRGCTLHIVEVLAAVHLRNALGLSDGDRVDIRLCRDDIAPLSPGSRIVWGLFWSGRRHWFYKSRAYSIFSERWAGLFRGTQKKMGLVENLKSKLRRHEKVMRLVRYVRKRRRYEFKPMPVCSPADQVQNLINYAKTSGSDYSAARFPAGYHSLDIGGKRLNGQRDPAARLGLVPFDFQGKSVLDIGCNQGGMLHALGGTIRYGIGIDYDPNMINTANRVRAINQSHNLHFYVFDLERDPLSLVRDLCPDDKVDIVLLLSVCRWIENWREVMRFSAGIADAMLFESNGTPEQQSSQIAELSKLYPKVIELAGRSEDDPVRQDRALFLASGDVPPGARPGLAERRVRPLEGELTASG